jgi:hypothetical protein
MAPRRKPVNYVSERQALDTVQQHKENPPVKQAPELPINAIADTANVPISNLYKTSNNASYTAKMKLNAFAFGM